MFPLCRRIAVAIATSLVMLLVFLPMSVASIRTAIEQSSNSNSEEHEEHEEHEETDSKEAIGEQVAHPPILAVVSTLILAPLERAQLASSTPPVHPSQYGVRRLL